MGDVMYHVLHRRRIKTMAGACNVLEHNLRIKIIPASDELKEDEISDFPDYLDAESMKYNVMEGCLSREAFCIEYQRMLDNAKLERKIQRNASRVIETIVSSSHSFCEDWKTNLESKETLKRYLEDAVKWEEETHGDVVLCVTYHWDELTPHAHILSVPLVSYTDKITNEPKLKFSASEFFGGKGDLIKMHTDFHEKVGSKYGLERGQCGSRASHKELKDYKNWEREQRESLKEKEALLEAQERSNNEQQKKNAEIEHELSRRAKEVAKRESKVESDVKTLAIKQKEFDTVVVKSNQPAPQIPEPPISLSRSKLKAWADSVQENVSKAFRGIKAAYESLVIKYNKAVDEIHGLRDANKRLYDEYVQIKHDLQNKPISEILAYRDYAARRKNEQDKQETNKGRDYHGHSR